MRAVLAREMVGRRVLSRVWSGGRRGLGVRPVPEDAGFGTEPRHQRQPRGSRQRSGPLGDQPFPGLLPKNLSREELVDALRAAVVDRKGKPGELTLFSVLPELSQSLGLREQELQVVRASGKESSGLVLLSSCPQTASRLQKFFTHARRAQRPTATYCAVTNGIPAASEGKIQAALKVEHIDGVNLTVPVKAPSRKDILEGVKKTLSHFRVVATGSGCALVQLQPLTGSPLRRLHLTPSQAAQLPLHLSLHRLLLPGTRDRDTPIELLAPLPPYFSRTLQCLGLRLQ
uniref:RNA pseudouridine synthase D3 n=1 Tax=Nomascus leucogenys TaxID=61853 RepID=A0A2I3HL51_NOMLE